MARGHCSVACSDRPQQAQPRRGSDVAGSSMSTPLLLGSMSIGCSPAPASACCPWLPAGTSLLRLGSGEGGRAAACRLRVTS